MMVMMYVVEEHGIQLSFDKGLEAFTNPFRILPSFLFISATKESKKLVFCKHLYKKLVFFLSKCKFFF